MKTLKTTRPRKWASANANPDLLSVSTWSGYAMTCADPFGPQYDLCADVDDETLGAAVLDCLKHSRFLDSAELRDQLFDYEACKRNYSTWVERLMQFGSYKSRRALFKQMKSCEIEQEDDTLTITPSHHEKLEGWSGLGLTPADNVVILASAPPTAIGAALREALRRCT